MEDTRQYQFNVNYSSTGSVSLSIDLQGEQYSEVQKEEILTRILTQASNDMINKGYVHFLSPTDISRNYGKTRQYWEKLIKQGKIPYLKTASGKIVTNLNIEAYLKNKEDVDKYSNAVNYVRKKTTELYQNDGKISGVLICPFCNTEQLQYNYNSGNHINALCRNSECHFRVDTQK